MRQTIYINFRLFPWILRLSQLHKSTLRTFKSLRDILLHGERYSDLKTYFLHLVLRPLNSSSYSRSATYARYTFKKIQKRPCIGGMRVYSMQICQVYVKYCVRLEYFGFQWQIKPSVGHFLLS